MVAALVAVGVLAALAATVAIVSLLRVTPGPKMVGKTVVVHTKDGKSIRGVLYGHYVDRFVIVEATLLGEPSAGDPRETTLAGPQHVLMSNVSFVQEYQPETES